MENYIKTHDRVHKGDVVALNYGHSDRTLKSTVKELIGNLNDQFIFHLDIWPNFSNTTDVPAKYYDKKKENIEELCAMLYIAQSLGLEGVTWTLRSEGKQTSFPIGTEDLKAYIRNPIEEGIQCNTKNKMILDVREEGVLQQDTRLSGSIAVIVCVTYFAYKCIVTKFSPIIIHYNLQSELQIIPYCNSKTYFDYYDNGTPIKTSWIQGESAIIAYDQDASFSINSASEIVLTFLCPESTTDFEALLSKFDTNQDMVFSAADFEYNKFLLWQDLNMDGISQKEELTFLSTKISSINFNKLLPPSTQEIAQGIQNKAVAISTTGEMLLAYDIEFIAG